MDDIELLQSGRCEYTWSLSAHISFMEENTCMRLTLQLSREDFYSTCRNVRLTQGTPGILKVRKGIGVGRSVKITNYHKAHLRLPYKLPRLLVFGYYLSSVVIS